MHWERMGKNAQVNEKQMFLVESLAKYLPRHRKS